MAVTRDAELRQVLADKSDTFVRGNAAANWWALREGRVDPASSLVILLTQVGSLLAKHGPEHTRCRAPLQRHFTPKRVRALEPRVSSLAARLLDDLDGHDTVDLKESYAWPLTVGVLTGLLGVEDTDAPVLGDIARRLFELQDPGVYSDAYAFIGGLIEHKRTRPGDDLVSALVIDHGPGPITGQAHAELSHNLFLLVIAGFETTMGALTNGIQALLNHPDQLAVLQKGAVPWQEGIEEILRRYSSVSLLPAVYTTRDTTLGGCDIGEGELLLLAYAAAARDPGAWEQPEVFDVARGSRGHLAFGHGPHFCLGAPLARLELEVGLRSLFTRYPRLSLAPGHEAGAAPVASWMMHHPRRLRACPGASRLPE
nr:cytochrome P450 [Streptomonospora sp. PA3]